MKTIRKIQLTACPGPGNDDEIEQNLTVTANDRFWLTRYRRVEGRAKFELTGKETGSLYKGRAERILAAIQENLDHLGGAAYRIDGNGFWDLYVYFDDGSRDRIYGDSEKDDAVFVRLSDMIRQEISEYSLYAFDGGGQEPAENPIRYFGHYLPLIYENTYLWTQFQYLCEQFFEPHFDRKRYFAFIRDTACIDIWEQFLDNMGGGLPPAFYCAAASFILAYKDAGHDIDAELAALGYGPDWERD